MTTHTFAADAATKYLQRPEGRIGYDVQGEGPLVVLVPGMGELRSSYRFLTPALVAAGYKVVATDLRGHGDSDATFSHYGDEDTADDVEALLVELGEPAFVAGNSLSAGSAVIVDARRPDLVNGLILIGPFVRNAPTSAFSLAIFHAMMAPLWAATSWKSYMPTVYKGLKPVDFDEYRARVYSSLRRSAYGKAFSLTTRTDHAPAEAALASVTSSVLVIMGELDPDFKVPATEAHWIGDRLHGEVVMVPNAGHYPQSQQPEITSTAVVKFLNTVSNHA